MVAKFVMLHSQFEIAVDTKKPVKVNLREKLQGELDALRRKAPRQYKDAHERAYWETLSINKARQLEKAAYGSTEIEIVPDERFNDLASLEDKYMGIVRVPKKEWREVEAKLYPLVCILNNEARIRPGLDLPKLPDLLEFQELIQKVSDLAVMVNAMSFDFKPLLAEAKKRGWPV